MSCQPVSPAAVVTGRVNNEELLRDERGLLRACTDKTMKIQNLWRDRWKVKGRKLWCAVGLHLQAHPAGTRQIGTTAVTPRASQELHSALRKILSGAYDVKLANAQLLNHQPWPEHTSLIVFPSIDPSEHDGVVGNTRGTIRRWVGRGGRYLGLGTGARFAETDQLGLIDLTWSPVPSPTLPSSPSSQSYTEVVFPRQTEQTPTSSSKLLIEIGKPTFETNFRVKDDQLSVWAHYQSNHNHHDHIAGVWTAYQMGYLALVGFDLSLAPERLIEILSLIGLEGLSVSENPNTKSSALYLISSPSSPSTQAIYRSILERCTGEQEHFFEDALDTFTVFSETQLTSPPLPTNDTLPLFLCPHYKNLPQPAPSTFDWDRYFSLIESPSQIGTTILYAETVASTQTLLEKNTKLSDLLPSGTVSIAEKQTNGRGRGSNNWISTAGSIQFSVLLKATNLGSSVVFVQYLFGLAVIEWLEKWSNGKVVVRLKWPNDIYGSITGGHARDGFRKMGGILVNCSFGGLSGTDCKLVIGCGMNNYSAPQSSTTSLTELIRAARKSMADDDGPDCCDRLRHPSTEEILAGILGTFGHMWTRFQAQGFQPFLPLYLSRWLHSDQVIRYEKTGEELKIVGIDPSYGLLRTQLVRKSDGTPVNHQVIVDLQPDSNSFDMFSGLIKTKN
ncbi:biotin holocarboxylase synthetase [Puccinia graminis f. sp. tritici]|uniref:Biotin holocarboxylase synthetase n=2 Tax=Puccinia graminis f. sp. tritici TaxID=56615 RepID=A0A5B0S1S4_PUCGR|nr:biotin holocarboxylase synthetase [Puccinia graminis f. sp. tritici]